MTVSAAKAFKNGRKKGSCPQGASSLVFSENFGVWATTCKGVLWLFRVLPWRHCFAHLGIFGFWVTVLTGIVFGARWIDRPVTRIEVNGDFIHLQLSAIEAELSAVLEQSFYGLELEEIQAQLESRPWVKTAIVARKWPNVLRIDLTEERPMAGWNGQGFINAEGQVFSPVNPLHISALPLLYGGEGKEKKVLSAYQRWQSKLSIIELNIQTLTLEPRGAWQMGFDKSWTLNLGKTDVEERLQRFIAVYGKRLYRDVGNILAVDARYTQGVAVTWKEPEKDPEHS